MTRAPRRRAALEAIPSTLASARPANDEQGGIADLALARRESAALVDSIAVAARFRPGAFTAEVVAALRAELTRAGVHPLALSPVAAARQLVQRQQAALFDVVERAAYVEASIDELEAYRARVEQATRIADTRGRRAAVAMARSEAPEPMTQRSAALVVELGAWKCRSGRTVRP